MKSNNTVLTELVRTIGKTVYAAAEEISEDEKWNIPYKLKGRGGDAISWLAEGLGSIDPRDSKWALGKSRASLFALREIYKHANDVGLVTMNPEVMVWIDDALSKIDIKISEATKNIPGWFKEMEPPTKERQQ